MVSTLCCEGVSILVSKRSELRRIAAELYGLREAALAVEEPFLVYLMAMAVVEAERLSDLPNAERPKKAEAPQLVSA
ncbi:MAG TPA: hypothetical protein VHG92_07335 [Afifellaceae bacterium]|nr:hypothetical protein [Afifellaceae bacterium]